MEHKKLTESELIALTQKKIANIPVLKKPGVDKAALLERNRKEDRENFNHTMSILQKHHDDAVVSNDRKKRYAAIAVASDQRGQFHTRDQLSQLEHELEFMQKSIPEDDWVLLEPLLLYSDEICITGNFNEEDLHRFIKEDFNIPPKYIVKLLNMIKIQTRINLLKESNN